MGQNKPKTAQICPVNLPEGSGIIFGKTVFDHFWAQNWAFWGSSAGGACGSPGAPPQARYGVLGSCLGRLEGMTGKQGKSLGRQASLWSGPRGGREESTHPSREQFGGWNLLFHKEELAWHLRSLETRFSFVTCLLVVACLLLVHIMGRGA